MFYVGFHTGVLSFMKKVWESFELPKNTKIHGEACITIQSRNLENNSYHHHKDNPVIYQHRPQMSNLAEHYQQHGCVEANRTAACWEKDPPETTDLGWPYPLQTCIEHGDSWRNQPEDAWRAPVHGLCPRLGSRCK